MSKIKNIGLLDVRNINEDISKEISQISNISFLIESDRSRELLKTCKMKNIGASMKVPTDVKVISQNGELHIDREYLECLPYSVIIILNGKLTLTEDIDVSLIDEKIYSMIINGEAMIPKRLTGIIQSKTIINGELEGYNSGYILIDDTIKMTNQFLNSLNSNSKLAIRKLLITEDIDLDLFKEKISNLQVLSKIIMTDENEKVLSKYIDKYYSIDKTIIPAGAKYIDDDLYIDDNSIKRYKDAVLYVDGGVEIYLKGDTKIDEYIKLLMCEDIVCNDRNVDEVLKILGDEDIEIEVIKGRLIKNNGKMVLAGKLEELDEEINIRNFGKLVLEEDLDYEKFNEKVESITNYGLVVAPDEKLGMVKNKVKENFGAVSALKEKKKELVEEDILYANMGELVL